MEGGVAGGGHLEGGAGVAGAADGDPRRAVEPPRGAAVDASAGVIGETRLHRLLDEVVEGIAALQHLAIELDVSGAHRGTRMVVKRVAFGVPRELRLEVEARAGV